MESRIVRPRLHVPITGNVRSGFSLAESMVSVTLVGVLMVTSLQTMVSAKRRERDTAERLAGQQIAAAMMSEILLQAFKEPQASPPSVFGPESGESNGNRSLFDDVDDFHGWADSPPVDRSGNTIPGLTGWTRNVVVQDVDAETLAPTLATNSGLKRITVTVSRAGITLGTVVGFRGAGWVRTLPSPSDPTGNRPPVAVATSPNLSRKVMTVMSFSASASSDPDGDPLSYVWNFGDGSTAEGISVNRVYQAVGTYTCTLTVYDGRGGTASAALTAVVTAD